MKRRVSRVGLKSRVGCRVESRVFIMWRKFERRCLDCALGDSEEVDGVSGEVELVKRLTYCVECIGYPPTGFRNCLSFSSVL